MAEERLIEHIKNLLQQGYDLSTIRNSLVKYGYSFKEIDEAVNLIYKPTIRHEIHLSRTTVLVIVFIFVSLFGMTSFFYFSYFSYSQKPSTKLLDLNLEPIATTVTAGENVIFLKELSNLGSSKRYDVIIKQEIIEPKTSKVIIQKIETRAIETFGSTQTRILVPQDTKVGDYILRTIVEYDNKKAIATLPIKIVEFKANKTKEQIENIECNDNNQCTNDAAENNVCVFKPITPCCGNNICEVQEQESCIADCKKPTINNLLSTETLDEIKETAKIDPSKALQQCNQIEVPDLKDTCISNIGDVQHNKNYCTKIANSRIKDLCYSNIAKSTNDYSLCAEISTDSRRDSCHMTFILDNDDYSICDKLVNKNMRDSCESLRQLSELSK